MPTSDFQAPVDIANQALQFCGATRIAAFTDDSKEASETAFCYDKLRRAELRRNVWRFAIRKTVLRAIQEDTLELVAPAYDPTDTYLAGAIVTSSGKTYIARTSVPITSTPSDNPSLWGQYFGPLVAQPYDDEIAYFSGELVYTPATDAYDVYLSLENSNDDDPTVVPAWDATVTYRVGETVTYSATVYQSTTDLNLNNVPNGSAPWVVVPVTQSVRMQGRKWLRLNDAELRSLNLSYPIQAGPASLTTTRNIFRLPAGYLRRAPQDPKEGSTSFLGAPCGLGYDDWELEGDYIVSRTEPLIILRFVADIADVPSMDPMFCQGLAARIALTVCEPLTQSTEKLSNIGSQYKLFMSEARIVNGIETGPTEPPEDDYIACRV